MKLKNFIKDKSGSETVEMVFAVGVLCLVILTTISIVAYAIQADAVAYACKRITRYIEVQGEVNQADLNSLLYELLPNAQEIEAKVSVGSVDERECEVPMWTSTRNKIQMLGTFKVTVTAKYKIPIAQIGAGQPVELETDVIAIVDGQVERYWKK